MEGRWGARVMRDVHDYISYGLLFEIGWLGMWMVLRSILAWLRHGYTYVLWNVLMVQDWEVDLCG